MPRLPTFPYLVNVSRDGAADEAPIARFLERSDAEAYAAWRASIEQPGVWRVRDYRRPATLYSAGTPAGE